MKGEGEMRVVLALNRMQKRTQRMAEKMASLKRVLEGAVAEIAEVQEVKHSGWYVLMKRDGDAWKAVGTMNPDLHAEAPVEDWDLTMAIPDPATVPEFQGW